MAESQITLEEFKKIIGKKAELLPADKLDFLYRVHTSFADAFYKSWIKDRKPKTVLIPKKEVNYVQ